MVERPLTGVVFFACAVACLSQNAAQYGTIPNGPAVTRKISVDQAVRMAEANEPAFAAANAESKALALAQRDARASLLPTVKLHTQALYTEPNGSSDRIGQTASQPAPVFIANNAVREYATQGLLDESVGFAQVAAVHVAEANAARAAAELEIIRRGLVAAVSTLYYTVDEGPRKAAIAERALAEADHFLEVSKERENAREAAHSDVVKAQLQQLQRRRELSEVKLTNQKERTELGALLFPDPSTEFSTATSDASIPDPQAVESAAQSGNPELHSALATLRVSAAETTAARAALLPQLSVNLAYGIDAPQYAVNGPTGTKNLGYSAGVALDFPVWDWFTTERKIKESRLRRTAAEAALSTAQRRLLANLSEFYAECLTARDQLALLEESTALAREGLRLANLRYVDGEASVLEVTDAEQALITAETAQSDGRLRLRTALAQLQILTGNH